jgi:hypothetical protein
VAELGRGDVFERSALIVNHEHREPPVDRSSELYGRRPEFLTSLRHVVVPSLALFAWWRDARYETVAEVLLHGPNRCYPADRFRVSDQMAERPLSERQARLTEHADVRGRFVRVAAERICAL